MTTRVTCTNPDGGHILGRPVAEGETVEVDDEIASVLDPDVWKTDTPTTPPPPRPLDNDTSIDDEKGKAE